MSANCACPTCRDVAQLFPSHAYGRCLRVVVFLCHIDFLQNCLPAELGHDRGFVRYRTDCHWLHHHGVLQLLTKTDRLASAPLVHYHALAAVLTREAVTAFASHHSVDGLYHASSGFCRCLFVRHSDFEGQKIRQTVGPARARADKSVGAERRKSGGVMTQMSAPGQQQGQREDAARVGSIQALRLGVGRRAAPVAAASAWRTATSDQQAVVHSPKCTAATRAPTAARTWHV